MRFVPALLVLALVAPPLLAQTRDAPFLVRERGEAYESLQDAVDAIGGGRGTIVIAPGRYAECAVQDSGHVTFLAERPGTAILDGVACEDKGALVLGGRSAAVEGLVFQNIRVDDANGAGIRLEDGDLTVSRSLFRDGENGILAANDHRGTIRVEYSTFSALGLCPEDQGCSHAIYNSGSGSLIVSRSRFERGTGGHYVKSRAPRIDITDSSFDDTAGRGTNYMVDLPEGATGTIARNIFVQGRDKENFSALIAVAAEGAEHSSAGLAVADNDASLAPGAGMPTAFVADYSGDALEIGVNRLGPRVARFERR
jgi:hypothetical protein